MITAKQEHYFLPDYELVNYIRQLSGMANNINQIAHKANAAGYPGVHKHCLYMNERLDNVISKIEDDC